MPLFRRRRARKSNKQQADGEVGEERPDRVMVDMDMASLGYWMDINGFFTMEHKGRFMRWMIVCLVINLSQTSMMYMLFVEEIDFSLSI
tara:strand:- start:133 stop:399 length:267 start_codon:yes stop_codon:yes gene_type:complete